MSSTSGRGAGSPRRKTASGFAARWGLMGTGAAFTMLVGLVGACSLFVNASVDQCSKDGDCAKFGAFRCVNASCVSVKSDVGQDAAPPRCTSNAQCIRDVGNGAEPYRCDERTGQCQSLKLSGVCPIVYPQSEALSDASVVLGGFLPMSGGSPLDSPYAMAYMLALDELKSAGGLPGGGGSPRRPLAMVFCDSTPGIVETGVKHLVNTIQVPATLALFSSSDLTRFVQDYFLPKGIFTLNPSDAPDALRNLDTRQLVWSLIGPPSDVAKAYRPALLRVQSYVQQEFKVAKSAQRIALVSTTSSVDAAMDAVLKNPTKGIVFDGKPLENWRDSGRYLPLVIPSFEATGSVDVSKIVDQLAQFKPHVVVLLTSSEAGDILPGLETKLQAAGQALPTYVLGPRNDSADGVLRYLRNNDVESFDRKRRRVIGVQYAGAVDRTQYESWFRRMRDKYSPPDKTGTDPERYRNVENYYDAVYWLAYGLFAAGYGTPNEGASYALGVRRLLAGTGIHPGDTATISTAFSTLQAASDRKASFEGALGMPAVDSATGEWRSVGGVYCYNYTGTALEVTYDRLRYDPATGGLTGVFDCFTGFPSSDADSP